MNSTQSTDTRNLVADVVEILGAAGWRPTWPACRNAMTDEMGSGVAVHYNATRDDAVHLEFSHALPGGVVETMYLDATLGATRIAKIILVAADAPED